MTASPRRTRRPVKRAKRRLASQRRRTTCPPPPLPLHPSPCKHPLNPNFALYSHHHVQAPSADTAVNLHFIAFVEKDGCLYELDGRKDSPINHGKTTPDTLLEVSFSSPHPMHSYLSCVLTRAVQPAPAPTISAQDTATVIRGFMERDPGEVNFNVIALAKSE